jgi:hypothetical protein
MRTPIAFYENRPVGDDSEFLPRRVIDHFSFSPTFRLGFRSHYTPRNRFNGFSQNLTQRSSSHVYSFLLTSLDTSDCETLNREPMLEPVKSSRGGLLGAEVTERSQFRTRM